MGTRTPQVTSRFGDDQLFFRHERVRNDIDRMAETDAARSEFWDDWLRERFRPRRENAIADWSNDYIEDMPDGDMQEIVELSMMGAYPGAEGLTCPFAWLLAGKSI